MACMLNEARGVGRMLADDGAHLEYEVKTGITPPSRCAALGRVEPELVGLPGKV